MYATYYCILPPNPLPYLLPPKLLTPDFLLRKSIENMGLYQLAFSRKSNYFVPPYPNSCLLPPKLL